MDFSCLGITNLTRLKTIFLLIQKIKNRKEKKRREEKKRKHFSLLLPSTLKKFYFYIRFCLHFPSATMEHKKFCKHFQFKSERRFKVKTKQKEMKKEKSTKAGNAKHF